MKLIRQLFTLAICLLLIGCASEYKPVPSHIELGDYIIVSGSDSLFATKINISTYNKDSTLVEEIVIDNENTPWHSSYSNNVVSILGDNTNILINLVTGEITTIATLDSFNSIDITSMNEKSMAFIIGGSSKVDDVSYHNGQKVTDDTSANNSVCYLDFTDKNTYDQDDYSCIPNHKYILDLILVDNEINILEGYGMDNSNLVTLDLDFNIINEVNVGSANKILSYDNNELIFERNDGYYQYPKDITNVIEVENNVTNYKIERYGDSYLRSNYSDNGNKLYLDTITDDILTSILLEETIDDDFSTIENTNDTNVVTLYQRDSKSNEFISFYDVEKKEYLDFKYQFKDNKETVLAAHYIP